LACISQRRGVTPLVTLVKRSGYRRAKSAKIVSTHQLRVQRRHAVDLVRRQHRQAGHAHAALAVVGTLVDQRQAAHDVFVAGKAGPDLLEEAPVDLVDDFHVARQQRLEQRHGPGLQRLGHQRVVGVAHRLPGDAPGIVPLQAMLVDQQPHQFGWHQGRVRIVQVHAVVAPEVVQGPALGEVARQHVLQRRRHQQELLLEPHLAAGMGAVVRVQHPVEHVGGQAFPARRQVLATAERREVDRVLARRVPLAQRGHALGAVAGHDEVERRGHNSLGRQPYAASAVGLHPAAEADHPAQLRALDLPRVAALEPVVRHLDLAPAGDLLGEHAVLVAHAVAERRQAQRGEGVEEAGGQSAQSAVAQRRVGLALEHVGQRRAGVGAGLAQRVVQAERGHRVAQRAAHQEFHRQVVHAARRLQRHSGKYPGLVVWIVV
jgi:hypothetical protein